MKKMIQFFRRKPRRVFIAVYLLAIIAALIYGMSCSGEYCFTWSFLPIIPGMLLYAFFDRWLNPQLMDTGDIPGSWMIGGIVITLIIVYVVGILFEKIKNHFSQKKR